MQSGSVEGIKGLLGKMRKYHCVETQKKCLCLPCQVASG